jgi:hypothetical protein
MPFFPKLLVLETKKTHHEIRNNVGALISSFVDFAIVVNEEAMPPRRCGF